MKRTPWAFHVKYCEGHKSEYGWVADGRSERADTELPRRLAHIMIKRPRSVIWSSTPPKTRQVIRVDVGADEETLSKELKRLTDASNMWKALERTLHKKVDSICENVLDGLGAGEKCIVWVLTRESVEIMTRAIEKACSDKTVRTLMKEQGVKIWATHGEADVKVRNDLAGEFRAHPKAGVLVATMDSLPESISLFGATVEHYAQLHYLPGPMVQSENRPYLKDTSKLHIIYYIAKGTIDERIEALVLPRVSAMDKLMGEKDAQGISSILKEGTQTESIEDFIARLTRGVPDDGAVNLGGDDFSFD